jgi:glycosyltransferase involved in cell wall biosynthesis
VIVFRADLLPGSETFIKEQILALRRWDAVLTGLRFVRGLDVSSLRCELLSGWFPQKVARRMTAVMREMNAAPFGVLAQLRRLGGSIVHIHFATDLVAIWPAVRLLGLPTVTTLHGYDINIHKSYWGRGNRASQRYPERLVSIAQHAQVKFIAVSEAIRGRAIEYGIPADKIIVKHVGIDATRFAPRGQPLAARARRVLYVGRLVEKKGGAILIAAFAQAQSAVPGAELVMIGDGPERAALVELAKRAGVNAQFLGSRSSEQVKDELDRARVLCLPSITARNGDAEGFGLVLLEAQACGVPVITSARGGATDGMINGVTGVAFDEGDVTALTGHLVKLLTDDAMAMAMSRAGPEFVAAKFDLRRCTADLEDLYDSMV